MNRASSALVVVVICLNVAAPQLGVADELALPEIVAAMRESQARFFRVPGGLEIRYRIEVDQPAAGPVAFTNGTGTIRVKWPLVYSRFETVLGGRQTVREANYDFEKKHSTALDGKSEAVISPYRSAWSAAYLFPLRLCYFVQADQYYFEGAAPKSNTLLPNALEQSSDYRVVGMEDVDGIACLLVERPESDRLWLAREYGLIVCKRELAQGETGRLQVSTSNRRFREIAPRVWLPTDQVQQHFDVRTGQLAYALHVTIEGTETGSLSEKSLAVVIPEDVLQVHDQFRNVVVRNPAGARPFTAALAEARRELGARAEISARPIGVWLSLAVVLGIVLLILVWQARRGPAAFD